MQVHNIRNEQFYDQALKRAEQLHERNKLKIRTGLIMLVLLPVILGLILWVTKSDKIVFLIIWVLCMFLISAYLIGVEYLDDSILKTLNDMSSMEAEFDDLLETNIQERLHERVLERRAARAARALQEEEEE